MTGNAADAMHLDVAKTRYIVSENAIYRELVRWELGG